MADFNNLSIAAREDRALISSLSTLGLTRMPDNLSQIFNFRPLETDLGFLTMLGRMREAKAESGDIYHHEKNKIIEGPTVNTSTTLANVYGTGSGTIISEGKSVNVAGVDYIQLAPESHSPSNGPTAGKYSYPRVGDIIMWANQGFWQIFAKDETNANAHRCYIKKLNGSSTPNLSATITNVGGTYGGDRFAVLGDAREEATKGMQRGVVTTYNKFQAFLQTFTDIYDITDQAENIRMIQMSVNGRQVNFHYEIGLQDTEERFMMKMALGLFVTPRSEGQLVDPETGQPIETTQAYIPALEAGAPKLYYSGTPTIELFKEMVRLKNKLYQDPESMLWYGQEFGLKVMDFLTDFIQDTGTTLNAISGKPIADIDLNFATVKLLNHTFKMRQLDILHHADTLGLDGMPYPHYFFLLPTKPMKDPKSQEMNYPFSILWAPTKGRGARGHYKIFERGFNSESGDGERYNREIRLYSRKGIQTVGVGSQIFGKPQ